MITGQKHEFHDAGEIFWNSLMYAAAALACASSDSETAEHLSSHALRDLEWGEAEMELECANGETCSSFVIKSAAVCLLVLVASFRS